jgi:hypothetical protein
MIVIGATASIPGKWKKQMRSIGPSIPDSLFTHQALMTKALFIPKKQRGRQIDEMRLASTTLQGIVFDRIVVRQERKRRTDVEKEKADAFATVNSSAMAIRILTLLILKTDAAAIDASCSMNASCLLYRLVVSHSIATSISVYHSFDPSFPPSLIPPSLTLTTPVPVCIPGPCP